MLMLFLSLVVLAIYQLRLFGVQLQLKTLQSLPYRRQQMFGFSFSVAVYNDVISIAFKRIRCKVSAHPHIKGMMQLHCHRLVLYLPLAIFLCKVTPTSPAYDGSPSSSSTHG